MIVVVVIIVLSTIAVLGYEQTQNQANDASASALASVVKAGAERHYTDNNEYPLPFQLTGGTPDVNAPPASYAAAASELSTNASMLANNSAKLVPCISACSNATFNKAYVYYLGKSAATTTTVSNYTFTSSTGTTCTYTLPTSDAGGMSYLLAYWSSERGNWDVARSTKGNPTTSDTTNCKFKAL